MDRYKIVRRFFNSNIRKRTLATGLTLEEAQEYCNNLETSSSTCKRADNVRRTKKYGPWFDGYEIE